MRPRRVRLGCAEEREGSQRAPKRFNEAEACAPRMLRPPTWRRCSSRRFNEAEACAPRMPRRIETEGDRDLASMRPRRVRLGCFGTGYSTLSLKSALQ